MIERLFVYKQIKDKYPEEFNVRILEFDRKKLNYNTVKEFKFKHERTKHKYLIPLIVKLTTLALDEKCSVILGDKEFKVNYLFEKYHN